MSTSVRSVGISAALFASMLAAPAISEVSQQETAKVWQVDMSGRPPYQRTLVDAPVIDAAAMEIDANAETQLVWTTDYSGKPPFRRSLEELPVIDAASLEADVQSEVERAVKAKPFFKQRHR